MFARLIKEVARSRLTNAQEGAAMIEFGLAIPLLMLLTLGGLEFTNFVVAHHRVRQIAAMAADNASRVRTQMSEAYVNQLFVGVEKAGAAMKFRDRGRVILSSIQNNNANNGQWIRWQRCFGSLGKSSKVGVEDKGKNDSSLPNVVGLQAQAGSAIMYAEATYSYQPLFRNPFTSPQEIFHEVAFIVRQRTDFGISGASPARC